MPKVKVIQTRSGLVLVFAAAMGLAPLPVAAQTLAEALAAAYVGNPDLESERAKLRSIDEEVPQAVSNWRPQVTMSSSYGMRRIETFPDGGNNTDIYNLPRSWGLEVEQPLFRGFRTTAETQRAKNRIAAARARLVVKEQKVLLDTVEAYLDVLRTEQTLQLRRENEEGLRRQLEATGDRFRVGELTRTDVSQAESRYAQATAERQAAEGDVRIARANYAKFTGSPPGTLVQPSVPSLVPPDLPTALREARANNPNVVAIEYDERSARDNIELVFGELLPTLSATAGFDYDRDIIGADTGRRRRSLLAELTVPLYEAGEVYSRVRQAKQEASQALANLAEAKREVDRIATNAWESYATNRARIVSFEAQVQAQSVALEGVEQEQRVGSRSILDVLDAERELVNARIELVRAQRNSVVAGFTVIQSVGRLTARDLGLPVPLYDMTVYYERMKDKWIGTGVE
ncbi:MAG: TolC family outer membrane protein [Alphaproteobacteria bacterium]|nr:TolC family outer membrane protein [Alphaproteobacteria bacterium]